MGVECVDWFGVVALDFLDPRALLASDHCPPPSPLAQTTRKNACDYHPAPAWCLGRALGCFISLLCYGLACGSEHLCNIGCEPTPIWVIPCTRF